MPRFSEWSVDDVISQLSELGLNQYAAAFRKNDISGRVLPLLKDCHLKELGMTRVGHRLAFLKYVQSLGNAPPPSRPAPKPQNQAPPRRPAPEPDPDFPPAPATPPSRTRPPATPPRPAAQYDDPPPPARSAPPPKPKAKPAAKAPARAAAKPNYDDDNGYAAPPPPAPKRKPPVARGAPPPAESGGNDDRRCCSYCGRKFAADRIDKHEEICARASAKKTKVFDAKKQRLQGTEAAAYARNSSREPPKAPASRFREEHEQLVQALRAARQFTAYEQAKQEGKAVGPPPALPKYEMANDDRVQCPHCGRKFAEEAAARHISVCERMNAGGGGGGGRRTTPTARGRPRR